MKALRLPEMCIHFDHIWSFDHEFAKDLCRCYQRIQNNLNNAARTFIQDLKILDFNCENLVVRICEMPSLDSWISLKDFLSLRGYHLSEVRDIHCGDYSLRLPDTTKIGRIILRNLLMNVTGTHMEGNSWSGTWRLEHVMVSDSLQVDIIAPYTGPATHATVELDFLRIATDFLPEYEMDGQQPGYFRHLDRSLQDYIETGYGSAMQRKFRDFIIIHPAMKPSLTRLGVIDNIFSALQVLSGPVRRLLVCILNSRPLDPDWRHIFVYRTDLSILLPIHTIVYEHHKNLELEERRKSNNQKDKDGSYKEEESKCAKGNGDGDNPYRDEPFNCLPEGGVRYQRHVHYHGTKGSKDEEGEQQLQLLSDLELINAHQFYDVLPSALEGLTLYIDDFHASYSQETYDKAFKWADRREGVMIGVDVKNKELRGVAELDETKNDIISIRCYFAIEISKHLNTTTDNRVGQAEEDAEAAE